MSDSESSDSEMPGLEARPIDLSSSDDDSSDEDNRRALREAFRSGGNWKQHDENSFSSNSSSDGPPGLMDRYDQDSSSGEEDENFQSFEEDPGEVQNRAAKQLQAFVRGALVRRKVKRTFHCVRLQAMFRGCLVRSQQRSVIERLVAFSQFMKKWGTCKKLAQEVDRDVPDWASLRDQLTYVRQHELFSEDDERKEMDQRLTSSMENTLLEDFSSLEDDMEEVYLPLVSKPNRKEHETFDVKRIYLSGEVVKWLKNGDPKYKGFFIRRMKQLASGERSRILAKRLTGTTTQKTPIYETYLEQKSGFRILWTEKDDTLLVWYIAKHHRVSRLMRLIDDSKNRTEKQRVSIHDVEEMKDDEKEAPRENIVLDPLGNVPLKVYDIETDEIDAIQKKDWTPALHLTDEEKDVVETEGTVLLLGRSGTGKTVCICNRMEFDRQLHKKDPIFSQLFVARSPRLCSYVKKTIGERLGSEFVTFDALLLHLEEVLPKVDGVRDSFPEESMMKFSTFRREVFESYKGTIDPLIVWTNIRSFLKGSMEALQTNSGSSFVSREDYLSGNVFGKKRCRLSPSQRESVYDIFAKYQTKLEETNAWDSCDRILALLQRLIAAKSSHPNCFEGRESWCKWSKLYVDEVQDYTQAEILLFFHLSGPGNLFLAGDPAQNVTKGVEFRFDDIRSVGYHVAGQNRRLIPQKPKVVTVNFRSHAGILNAASAILTQLFAYFPDSAKQLGKDDGLFQGPRPGIFHKAQPETLASLVREKLEGIVILTHDDQVAKVSEQLGGYQLVYGIRRAKGLEFKSIIILDFFVSIPEDLQKPWRELLLNRADAHEFKSTYPEIEGHLKLLYTAVTRCIDRLFFAETEGSVAGDAFLRFMTNTESVKRDNTTLSIATKNNIEDIENMTMTQDEWLASGISNAEAAEAETENDHAVAESLLEKAIYCFQQSENESLLKKAKAQLASVSFRLDLGRATTREGHLDPTTWLAMETDAICVLENLLHENLLWEAKILGLDLIRSLHRGSLFGSFFQRHVLAVL